MNTNTRYLKYTELEQIAFHATSPIDCVQLMNIAISPISDILVFVESSKQGASTVRETEGNIHNIQEEVNSGRIHIAELSIEDIGYFLSDDKLFDAHLDKKTNPYDLSKCISLTVCYDAQWWDEDIYFQSI